MSKKDRVDDAIDLYEDFSGNDAEYEDTVEITLPDVAIEVGTVDGIMYTTNREGKEEKYIHKFKKNSRPLLAASHDGTQLLLIGGSYQFTEKGIEDR